MFFFRMVLDLMNAAVGGRINEHNRWEYEKAAIVLGWAVIAFVLCALVAIPALAIGGTVASIGVFVALFAFPILFVGGPYRTIRRRWPRHQEGLRDEEDPDFDA